MDLNMSLNTSYNDSRRGSANVEPEPAALGGLNLNKLRANVMNIQKSRLAYDTLSKNLAVLAATTTTSSAFRRQAIMNDGSDVTDVLKSTPKRDAKQQIQQMKNERNMLDRNRRGSFVSKNQVEEEIDLCYEDDRKLVISILKEKPEVRYEDEILYTQKMLESINFFANIKKELNPKSFLMLFGRLRLEEFEIEGKVFKEGSLGKKFYVIIQGSAYVLLSKKGITENQKKTDQEASQKKDDKVTEEVQSESAPSDADKAERVLKKKIEKTNPGTWIAKVIEQGQSFGDIALASAGERQRTATIIAREKLILGVLDYNDYNDILGEYYVKRDKRKMDLLNKMDLFQHWNPSQISSLLHHLEETTLHRKHVIFNEGETSNYHLYFILSGEVELRKTAATSTNDYFGSSLPKERRRSRLQGTETLALISQGEYFGEGEIMISKPREYTAVVHSFDVQILSISKEKFLFFVKDNLTLKKIKEHNSHKKHLHEGFINNFLSVNQFFSKQNLDISHDSIERSFIKSSTPSQAEARSPAVPTKTKDGLFPMTLSLFRKSKMKTHQTSQNQQQVKELKITIPTQKGPQGTLLSAPLKTEEDSDSSKITSAKDSRSALTIGSLSTLRLKPSDPKPFMDVKKDVPQITSNTGDVNNELKTERLKNILNTESQSKLEENLQFVKSPYVKEHKASSPIPLMTLKQKTNKDLANSPQRREPVHIDLPTEESPVDRRKTKPSIVLTMEGLDNFKVVSSKQVQPLSSTKNPMRMQTESPGRLQASSTREGNQVRMATEGHEPSARIKPSTASAAHRRHIKSSGKIVIDTSKTSTGAQFTFEDQVKEVSNQVRTLQKSASMRTKFVHHIHNRSPDPLRTQDHTSYQNDAYSKPVFTESDDRLYAGRSRAETPQIRDYQINNIQLYGSPRPQLYVSSSLKLAKTSRSPLSVEGLLSPKIAKKEVIDFFEEGRKVYRVGTALSGRRPLPEGHLRKKSLKIVDVRANRTKRGTEAETSRDKLSPSRSPDSSSFQKLDKLDIQRLQLRIKTKVRRIGS